MTVKVIDFGGKVIRTYYNCSYDEAHAIEVHESMNGYKVQIIRH